MAKAVHAMVRVLDEPRSIAFYQTAFGMRLVERADFENITLIYLRNAEADFEIELTVNKGRTKAYDLGDGYGHIALVVDALEAEHARLTAAGFSPGPIRQIALNGQPARFFFIADPDGYKVEVIQRGGRFA